jgi:hypothetical protein
LSALLVVPFILDAIVGAVIMIKYGNISSTFKNGLINGAMNV